MKRVTSALAAALSAALIFSACGGEDSTSQSSGGTAAPTASPSATPSATATVSKEHNTADVVFAQMMIPHHRQAVDMAKLAAARAAAPEVGKLAADIEKAQEPEIQTMSTWLSAWGQKVPAMGEEMDHSGHGGTAMPGMMTERQMAELERLSGAQFDRMFLSMMKEHHRGAVQMAEEEQKNGANPAAIALAEQIATTQKSEIELINRLIAQS